MKDISGKRYGDLVVLHPCGKGDSGRVRWLCRCDCGNEKPYFKNNLDNGRSHCGCKANRRPNLKHGARGHYLYPTWSSMVSRCHNSSNSDYHLYGGRGISVCPEWREDPWRFFHDMGERPDGFSIDRIDPDGDYCPDNCRWASSFVQSNNKRCNKLIDGKKIHEIAKELGVKTHTIYMRKRRGWTDEEIKRGFRTAKK